MVSNLKCVLLTGLVGTLLSGCATTDLGTNSISPETFIGTSSEAPPQSSFIEAGGEAAIPPGFISFCIRNESQCSEIPGQVTTVLLRTSTWKSLVAVNDRLNQSIHPKSDLEHYGRAEYWNIPQDGFGDCDDYAVAKRKALIDAGLPQGALRLAVVRTQSGDRHAVLTVATDKGDYVLDSLGPRVMAWSETNYVWLERQDPSHPWGWVAIKDN